jgi:hypothetical protein
VAGTFLAPLAAVLRSKKLEDLSKTEDPFKSIATMFEFELRSLLERNQPDLRELCPSQLTDPSSVELLFSISKLELCDNLNQRTEMEPEEEANETYGQVLELLDGYLVSSFGLAKFIYGKFLYFGRGNLQQDKKRAMEYIEAAAPAVVDALEMCVNYYFYTCETAPQFPKAMHYLMQRY